MKKREPIGKPGRGLWSEEGAWERGCNGETSRLCRLLSREKGTKAHLKKGGSGEPGKGDFKLGRKTGQIKKGMKMSLGLQDTVKQKCLKRARNLVQGREENIENPTKEQLTPGGWKRW